MAGLLPVPSVAGRSHMFLMLGSGLVPCIDSGALCAVWFSLRKISIFSSYKKFVIRSYVNSRRPGDMQPVDLDFAGRNFSEEAGHDFCRGEEPFKEKRGTSSPKYYIIFSYLLLLITYRGSMRGESRYWVLGPVRFA